MRGIKKFTVNLLMGANVASILLMWLVGYSDHLNPQSHPLLSCVGLVFPVMMLINLGFLIFWAVFSLKRVFLPLLGFLLCYGSVRTYLPLNVGSSEKADLKVVTYNTGGYSDNGSGEQGAELDGALRYVKNLKDADIVCLQEVTLSAEKRKPFLEVFPYGEAHFLTATGSGITLFSKHPILKTEKLDISEDGQGKYVSIAFLLDVNGQQVYVVNSHFETAGMSMEERSDFQDMVRGNKDRKATRGESKRLLTKLSEHNVQRALQINTLAKFLKRHADVPAIVCGDFNDTPISYAHYRMADMLTDCYRECGNGPGWTFNGSAIHVRIDHVFCSSFFTPVSCKVDHSVTSSDHFPVVCTLKMGRNTQN